MPAGPEDAGGTRGTGGTRTRDHALEVLRTREGASARAVSLALDAAARGDPDLAAEVRRMAAEDPVGAARRRGVVDDATDAAALALAKEPGGLAALGDLLARPESDRTPAVALAVWHALLAPTYVAALPPGLARRLADLAAGGTRPETRRCAALALARADRDALLRLPRGAPETAWPAANALATLTHDGDPLAVERAREEAASGCSPEVRRAAVLALDAAPEPARGEALAALAAGDPGAAETLLARELLAARASTEVGPGPAAAATKEAR